MQDLDLKRYALGLPLGPTTPKLLENYASS
jgi:hypothetical protein